MTYPLYPSPLILKEGNYKVEWTFQAFPNKETVAIIDGILEKYIELYNLSHMREIAFVVHELVVNAVEAMEEAQKQDKEKIQLNFSHKDEEIKITVTDSAGGIPEEYWDDIIYGEIEETTYSERGRGLFFIKHFVDQLWFDKISENLFLVGVSKKLKD